MPSLKEALSKLSLGKNTRGKATGTQPEPSQENPSSKKTGEEAIGSQPEPNQEDPSGKKPLCEERDGKLSLQLWDGAYTALKDDPKTKSLVIEYEDILTGKKKHGKSASATTHTNTLDGCSGQERLEKMKQITETLLEKAKHEKTEAAADFVLSLIDVAQDQVGGLLQAYPPAAIAWSGFCTLTPVRYASSETESSRI
jgi:hypothetical protein